MISNKTTQGSNQIRNQYIDFKSAFRPMNPQISLPGFKEMTESLVWTKVTLNNSKQLFCDSFEKQQNTDSDIWNRSQIQKLFKLYDYYGPQWKIMSHHMPTRTANNLKNRFYTVLRNLIKLLFRKMGGLCPKLPGEIPSKDLSRLYDGKQQYKQFKTVISGILKQLNFDLEAEIIDNVVLNYSTIIFKVYKAIYGQRVPIEVTEKQKVILKEEKKSDDITHKEVLCKVEELQDDQNQGDNVKVEKREGEENQKVQENCYYFFYYNPYQYYPYPYQGF